MYSLVLKERAVQMMKDSFEWYEFQKIGLGDDFLNEVDNMIHLINKNPMLFMFDLKPYRQAPLKIFPFVIYYEIIKTEIIVYAVFHTSKHPKRKL